MGRLFGTDGIRGIANTELTCELALNVGRAVATVLKNGNGKTLNIIVGCDTRRSADMLCSAIIAGICSAGANAEFVGCLTTPAIAFLTQAHSADAGIMLSASHNPAEYNGIKVFASDGIKLPDQLEEEIEAMLSSQLPFPTTSIEKIGTLTDLTKESITEYSEYLKKTVPHRLDGLNIAVDCANGASYRIAPRVFTELGANTHSLFVNPNGDNINDECGSTHLESMKNYVRTHKLDIGFAFDGDADRCICVDSYGNEIDGDRIMAMCALDMKERGILKNATVVGTVMTNLGFTRFCRDNGINFIATKVGDRFVLEEMLLGDFSLGGEQSGHIIFKDISKAGDGILTALQVLSLIKRSNRSVTELASVMKVYPQITVNIAANAEAKRKLLASPEIKALIKIYSEKLSSDGRLLVRPSGTEPLIRIMAEGIDQTFVKKTVIELSQKLETALSDN